MATIQETLYMNLPGDSSNTYYFPGTTNVSAGTGLTGGGSANSSAGVTVKANLKSETKSTLTAAAKGSTTNREYAVGLDVNGNLSVNVPWTDTDTNTTYSAGAGLVLSNTTFKADLKSETKSSLAAAAKGTTASREYAVGLDSAGDLSVNVPWTNVNSDYVSKSTTTAQTIKSALTVEGLITGTITSAQQAQEADRAQEAAEATHATDADYALYADDCGYADQATNVDIANDTTSKIYVLGATTTGATRVYRESSVYMQNNVLMGAAWNDYAEYRETPEYIEPGRVVCENGNDTLSLSEQRLQPGAEIVSDTFGFAIGETEQCKTPIAVSGRVLAYPYEDRNTYKPGDAVCAGPEGTVSKMTREEIREYPERIIGTVSAVPEYETWGQNNVPVNGRIWIRIR